MKLNRDGEASTLSLRMLKEDFVTQSEIRRMLIRTNINYTKINFGTVRGVVYFRGLFQISHHHSDEDEEKIKELTVKTLYSFEKKVRSTPGVSDVVFQFINWRKERGQWVPVEQKKKKKEEEDEREKDPNL
jgi:hypothetical protein